MKNGVFGEEIYFQDFENRNEFGADGAGFKSASALAVAKRPWATGHGKPDSPDGSV
jgi:hypothetical protein